MEVQNVKRLENVSRKLLFFIRVRDGYRHQDYPLIDPAYNENKP